MLHLYRDGELILERKSIDGLITQQIEYSRIHFTLSTGNLTVPIISSLFIKNDGYSVGNAGILSYSWNYYWKIKNTNNTDPISLAGANSIIYHLG